MSTQFCIELPSGVERFFDKWDEACGLAVSLAASGRTVHIDVLCGTREDAVRFGVDDEDFDPEASVTKRVEIRAEDKGRVS